MNIRTATLKDLEAIHQIEHKCFPSEEACEKDKLKERIRIFPNHFWVLSEKDKIIAFVNGFCTEEKDLKDIMYLSPSQHNESGAWQMVFGLACLPAYQHRGYASLLMKHLIQQCQKEHRAGIVLTCKEKKISFYEHFGFNNEGLSLSTHGNVSWYQMRLDLK